MPDISPARPRHDLRRHVDDLAWYHTFDLPDDIVTPGLFDHRKVVHRLPIPSSLVGMRCLDAASADGFFAFEMSRRGADEVVSVDLDDVSRRDWQRPPASDRAPAPGTARATRAFSVVSDALGLHPTRVDLSLYDLDPQTVGTFDFVFMGNVLLHLSDPARALRAVRSVTAPDGTFLSFEAISLHLSLLRPRTPLAQLHDGDESQWWTANMAGHRRLLQAGGWEIIHTGGPVRQPFGPLVPRRPERVPRSRRELVRWVVTRPVGVPSAWAIARPASAPTRQDP